MVRPLCLDACIQPVSLVSPCNACPRIHFAQIVVATDAMAATLTGATLTWREIELALSSSLDTVTQGHFSPGQVN